MSIPLLRTLGGLCVLASAIACGRARPTRASAEGTPSDGRAVPTMVQPSAAVHAADSAATWYAGPATCAERPAFRIREVRPGLFVLRQPACTHFEKPFLFLLVGRERALLLDTGAGGIDVAGPIDSLLGAWRAAHEGRPTALVVAHTHGHEDHVAGDAQFRARAGVTLVGTDSGSVHRHFGLAAQADYVATYELGGRGLDVLAIPGHEPASIAVYDRQSGVLLTGDTFYPGRLYVGDTAAFAASTARLVAFTAARPVTAILGTHIEQTRTPYVDYPMGTQDQPAEDRLELSRAELVALDSAVRAMRGRFVRQRLPRFTIWPL
jgi:glyoxylase-like metal-dependent hydrolase (beta-lactamase superfamily II)